MQIEEQKTCGQVKKRAAMPNEETINNKIAELAREILEEKDEKKRQHCFAVLLFILANINLRWKSLWNMQIPTIKSLDKRHLR